MPSIGCSPLLQPMQRLSIRPAVNHRPESRVRENRMHGSEGEGSG